MTVQEHLRQARQNEALAHKLGRPPLEAYDWAITVMFYALLHCVGAYLLERHHLIPRGHTATWDRQRRQRIPGRNDDVKQYLPEIYDPYKLLYDASRRARYEGAYLTAGRVGNYQNLQNNEFASARAFFHQCGW